MRQEYWQCVLLVSAILVSLSAAAPPTEPAVCLVEEFGRNHGRATAALVLIKEARQSLEAYDSLLDTVALDKRDPGFLRTMNRRRFELLKDALTAYYTVGPVKLEGLDDGELFERLLRDDLTYEHYQMPAALSDLVDFGIISHLPDHPNVASVWLDRVPSDQPPAGSILYLPLASKEPYLEAVAGLNEGWLLVAYGEEGRSVLLPENVDDDFFGELATTLTPLPQAAIALWGQDVNTIE